MCKGCYANGEVQLVCKIPALYLHNTICSFKSLNTTTVDASCLGRLGQEKTGQPRSQGPLSNVTG